MEARENGLSEAAGEGYYASNRSDGGRPYAPLVVERSTDDPHRTAGKLLRRAGTSPARVSDLNFLNRRMRTRMSGGVGGERRGHYAPPPLSRFCPC